MALLRAATRGSGGRAELLTSAGPRGFYLSAVVHRDGAVQMALPGILSREAEAPQAELEDPQVGEDVTGTQLALFPPALVVVPEFPAEAPAPPAAPPVDDWQARAAAAWELEGQALGLPRRRRTHAA